MYRDVAVEARETAGQARALCLFCHGCTEKTKNAVGLPKVVYP
jgi:cytochrome c553